MSADAIEALHAALDADPSDADSRLRLAGLLDAAAGRPTPEAEVQRWMATQRRWPDTSTETWDWWCFLPHCELEGCAELHRQHSLDETVFRALDGATKVSTWDGDCCYKEYPSRRAAEDALAAAFADAASG